MSEHPATGRPPLAEVAAWVREHYALVDAGELDRYISDFAPEVELRFASHAPVNGRGAVRDALAGGTPSTRWRTPWSTAGRLATRRFSSSMCSTPDGHSHAIPSVALVRRHGHGLIASLRVYLDPPH